MRGVQLEAPQGWMNLKKDVVYYLLKNDAVQKTVFLVIYLENAKKEYRAEIIEISRVYFEEGVNAKAIKQRTTQNSLPPWLSKFEGIDFTTAKNGELKERHELKVDEKVKVIESAVKDFDQILSKQDPAKVINQYARNATPQKNETRFRTELLTYILFGSNKWVFFPNYHGYEGAKDDIATVKQGAPSLANGKNFGFKMTCKMRKMCEEGFIQYADNGKFLSEVYIEVLKKTFGCKVLTNNTNLEIISTEQYPTLNQFRYVIDIAIGKEVRQKVLYGEARYRNKKAPSKGRFSEELCNLYEKIYIDAYQVSHRPRGFIENSILPAVHGAVSVDGLCGMPLGVGFSFGSEQATGYRMMLFCMAVNKKRFCKLFGIEIEEYEWPSIGLPPYSLFDRGAGSKKNPDEKFEDKFVIMELAQSWSGQSKATVETTHPKELKMEGCPTFNASDLSPVQIAIAEILRIIEYIKITNVEDRIDPLPELVNVYPTPLGIWNHYSERYRNAAIIINFEDAVRRFLTKVEFTVKEDAVYLHGRMFNCEELRETGIFGLGETKVEGYILDLCVRYVWIEWKGKLIEVPALHRIRGLEEDLYLSIAELEQLSQERAKNRSQLNADKVAVILQTKQRFEEVTGKDYDSAIKRKRGKIPKNDVSKHEASEVFASKNLKKAGGR